MIEPCYKEKCMGERGREKRKKSIGQVSHQDNRRKCNMYVSLVGKITIE